MELKAQLLIVIAVIMLKRVRKLMITGIDVPKFEKGYSPDCISAALQMSLICNNIINHVCSIVKLYPDTAISEFRNLIETKEEMSVPLLTDELNKYYDERNNVCVCFENLIRVLLADHLLFDISGIEKIDVYSFQIGDQVYVSNHQKYIKKRYLIEKKFKFIIIGVVGVDENKEWYSITINQGLINNKIYYLSQNTKVINLNSILLDINIMNKLTIVNLEILQIVA